MENKELIEAEWEKYKNSPIAKIIDYICENKEIMKEKSIEEIKKEGEWLLEQTDNLIKKCDSLPNTIKVLQKHLREDNLLYRKYEKDMAHCFYDEAMRIKNDQFLGLINHNHIAQAAYTGAKNFLDLLIKE